MKPEDQKHIFEKLTKEIKDIRRRIGRASRAIEEQKEEKKNLEADDCFLKTCDKA